MTKRVKTCHLESVAVTRLWTIIFCLSILTSPAHFHFEFLNITENTKQNKNTQGSGDVAQLVGVVFHARSPEFSPQHCKNRSFLSAVNCISILGLLLLSCSCSLLFVGDRVLRCSPGRTWTHGVTKAHFKLTTVLSHSPRGWYWRLQLADLAASHRLAHTLKSPNSDFLHCYLNAVWAWVS